MEISIMRNQSLGVYQKPIEYYEKDLKIAKEIGDRAGEVRAYGHLGNAYQSGVSIKKALSIMKNNCKLQ